MILASIIASCYYISNKLHAMDVIPNNSGNTPDDLLGALAESRREACDGSNRYLQHDARVTIERLKGQLRERGIPFEDAPEDAESTM